MDTESIQARATASPFFFLLFFKKRRGGERRQWCTALTGTGGRVAWTNTLTSAMPQFATWKSVSNQGGRTVADTPTITNALFFPPLSIPPPQSYSIIALDNLVSSRNIRNVFSPLGIGNRWYPNQYPNIYYIYSASMLVENLQCCTLVR